jgi:hypothetical protein
MGVIITIIVQLAPLQHNYFSLDIVLLNVVLAIIKIIHYAYLATQLVALA